MTQRSALMPMAVLWPPGRLQRVFGCSLTVFLVILLGFSLRVYSERTRGSHERTLGFHRDTLDSLLPVGHFSDPFLLALAVVAST